VIFSLIGKKIITKPLKKGQPNGLTCKCQKGEMKQDNVDFCYALCLAGAAKWHWE